MSNLEEFSGVRVINGVSMMSTKGIVDVCEKIGEKSCIKT
jgi:hypothetical protein